MDLHILGQLFTTPYIFGMTSGNLLNYNDDADDDYKNDDNDS